MTDEERAEVTEAFAAGLRGEITVEECADRLHALGIASVGIVSVIPKGQSLN